MENPKSNPLKTRTDLVISSLTGIKKAVEFPVAEKIALRRLNELEKSLKGISSKWVKNKTDRQMMSQIQDEMTKILDCLEAQRKKFKVF